MTSKRVRERVQSTRHVLALGLVLVVPGIIADTPPQNGRSRTQQRDGKRTTSTTSLVKHASSTTRSHSFSRLFTLISPSSSTPSENRTRAAHPFLYSRVLSRDENHHQPQARPRPSSSLSRSNTGLPKPKRPSLLDTIKVKSDPCIVIIERNEEDHLPYPRRSFYERRCEQGFIVTAESSLRDVL